MAANSVLFVVATLITLTLSDDTDKLFTIEVEIPKFLRGIVKKLFNSNNLMASSAINLNWDNTNDDGKNFMIRMSTKGMADVHRRGQLQRFPSVELGPGAPKTQIVTYPPNFLENRLKYLLKKKQEANAS